MAGDIECPKSEKRGCKKKLKPLLEGSSWVCVKAECNKGKNLELYEIKGMGLMTEEEIKERQRAEGEV